MVVELVQFGMHGGPNHLHVDTNHMYIYRNVDTVQMQNAHDDIPTVAMLDRDDSAPPLCIHWLVKIAKAWQHDPREWLECHLRSDTQHGAIPMPQRLYGRAVLPALLTTTPGLNHADWEKIQL